MRLNQLALGDPPPPTVGMLQAPRNSLALSCNCMRRYGDGLNLSAGTHLHIEVRTSWEPGEAIKRYRQHLAEVQGAAS